MAKLVLATNLFFLVLFLNLEYLLIPSLACHHCPHPINPPPPPKPKPCPPPPAVKPCPPPPARKAGCPIDVLKLDACVDVLGGLVHIGIGPGASEACCPVLAGLVDLDAAVCLCTTIRAKLLNINLLLPIALELLVDGCGKHVPADFKCPA